MLECVVNVSEGRRGGVIAQIAGAAGGFLLDVHSDADHNRSVLTIVAPEAEELEDSVVRVVAASIELIDLRVHTGAHPRIGAADVVPFVPLARSTIVDAITSRDRTAQRIADDLGVPCFTYGPERSLPDVRRRAFTDLPPDFGGHAQHATAGACCVGARRLLIAYNLWLDASSTIDDAREIAIAMRGPYVRTLGLQVADRVQVSCNLTEPTQFGPDAAFDAVSARAPVERAELVGLAPRSVLDAIPEARWSQLDLSVEKTIEARLSRAGLDGGRFDSGQN